MFDPVLFADPAWDMLLDLYITKSQNRRLSVTGACIGANAPLATALRYMSLLQERGLIRRLPDDTDGRRAHVELTDRATTLITELLNEL